MKTAGTVMIVSERNGSTIRVSLSVGMLVAFPLLVLVLAVGSAWLLLIGIESVESGFAELDDSLRLADQYATLTNAVDNLSDGTVEFEEILSVLMASLRGSSVGDQGSLPDTANDFLSLAEGESAEDQLDKLSQLLVNGSRSLEAGEGAVDLVNQRVLMHLPNAWPLPEDTGTISFEFGPSIHPFTKSWYLHKGVDIAAPTGTPVLAMSEGTVGEVRRDDDNYGLQVVVRSRHGFWTRFSHLSTINTAVGDTVEPGQRIGTVGMSGLATGPTLHLELYLGTEVLDPIPFLTMRNRWVQDRRVRS